MLSEPPPCDAAEVLGETWVAVGTIGKAWVLSVDTPTPLTHKHTNTELWPAYKKRGLAWKVPYLDLRRWLEAQR